MNRNTNFILFFYFILVFLNLKFEIKVGNEKAIQYHQQGQCLQHRKFQWKSPWKWHRFAHATQNSKTPFSQKGKSFHLWSHNNYTATSGTEETQQKRTKVETLTRIWCNSKKRNKPFYRTKKNASREKNGAMKKKRVMVMCDVEMKIGKYETCE